MGDSRQRWTEEEDRVLLNGWDMSPSLLQKNGLHHRNISSIRGRMRRLGIDLPPKEPTRRVEIRMPESMYQRCIEYIEDGEDGPTISAIIKRVLTHYLFESELDRQKYWRNLSDDSKD